MIRQRRISCLFLVLICMVLSFNLVVSQRSDEEVSWEFEESTSGWAASPEENDMEVYMQGGELRGQIIGPSAHIDSPRIAIDSSLGHSVVVRMMYTGKATNSRLYYRFGYDKPALETMDHSKSVWHSRPTPSVIDSSSSFASTSNVLDGDVQSSWVSESPTRESITFDLQQTVSVSKISLRGLGLLKGQNGTWMNLAPKQVLVFQSNVVEGPFSLVASAQYPNASDTLFSIQGIREYARYWKLMFVDSWGSQAIGVREVQFQGLDAGVVYQDFDLYNDGSFHTYYLPIRSKLMGRLTQMRLVVAQALADVEGSRNTSSGSAKGESVAIDYIRVVKAPIINKVSGCIDVFATNRNFEPLFSSVTRTDVILNDFLHMTFTSFNSMFGMSYGKTYNCVRDGGQTITISGIDFGDSGAVVTVGDRLCTQVEHFPGDEQKGLTCTLPPGETQNAIVRVANGRLPGLYDEKDYLSYASPPVPPNQPQLSNLASTSVDISWTAPENYLDAVIITGYVISTNKVGSSEDPSLMTVGNITTTTIRGLEPETEYFFQVAAMNENQTDPEWRTVDLYGRRDSLSEALYSAWSPPTDITATLVSDIYFPYFNANATVNHSAVDDRASVGPTGIIGGEGAYGINLVGDANVQNCNGSSICCDGFDPLVGTASCTEYACSGIGRVNQAPIINKESRREVPTNLPGGEKQILPWEEFSPLTPNVACGSAIRLTSSFPRQSGSFWYARPMNVREGFDTTFSFEISNPSYQCNVMQDVYTMCRSRGADGFAFVIQSQSPTALGLAGKGLGYEGINNSLAVEFDTFFNYDNLDAYENHISVQTKGWREVNEANHSYSLATSVRAPDLTEGLHTARIKYTPVFSNDDSMYPYFMATSWTTEFLQNADAPNGGMPDWGTGIGMLYVYLDNLVDPLFITPLNLDATLRLDNGKAWVGFTAATGENHYQVHDILDWQFTQLRIDPPYYPPPLVNEEGAYSCQSEEACVHP